MEEFPPPVNWDRAALEAEMVWDVRHLNNSQDLFFRSKGPMKSFNQECDSVLCVSDGPRSMCSRDTVMYVDD